MKYYSIGQFASLINVTTQTLRNWHNSGKLKSCHRTSGGHRCYSQEQLTAFLKLKGITHKDRIIIGYCRVSSPKQKDDLERQVSYLKEYMLAKGYAFEIIEDVGSGINYNKKGLNKLITKVCNSEVEKIVVLYKDRLIRFGFELIENVCKLFETCIEIVDNTPKTEEQELVEDLIQIVTVFSCKLQGKRAAKTKRILKELQEK